jgi:putative Mg2+ transporter-C (MgtC) family protein
MIELDIEWTRVLSHLIHLAIAYAIALPIGWHQERTARSAGLRTFPLVSMAACGYMLVGLYVLSTTDAESRVIYGIITGIGFIGGGAILKGKGSIEGTATAASIWTTGAIGVAVAFNRLEIAVLLGVLNFLTLQWGKPVKDLVREDSPD